MLRLRRSALLCTAPLALAACGGSASDTGADADTPVLPAESDDLVRTSEGKSDTGYLSTLATELEGVFSARVVIDAAELGPEARTELLAQYGTADGPLRGIADTQVRFSKNQLNTEKLHVNLTADDVQVASAKLEGDRLVVEYTVRAESIVSFEELMEAGISPDNLKDRAYPVRIPADPRELFTRFGEKCAEGFDPGSLSDWNYFYYFKPDKAGCDLPMSDATFTVHSLLPKETTFPEFDLLAADGKVLAFVVFGAAGHDPEVSAYDEGVREWKELVQALQQRQFRESGTYEGTVGKRWTRTRGGLTEVVDVLSPYDLHDQASNFDAIMKNGLRTHEIIIYNGHSFYGSLRVLEDPDAYPADTYQIIFMNSCWSYEYYTKQVFRHKATAADPTGWALADVLNDTESGWFLNMAEGTRILLTNVFEGAETQGRDGARFYTWANIVGKINENALDVWRRRRQYQPDVKHEIYGVSGVRTNRFGQPAMETPATSEWKRVQLDAPIVSGPYADNANLSFKVPATPIAGAKSLRFHFKQLALEDRYDWVEVFDGNGASAGRWSNTPEGLTTPELPGAQAEVRLISDYAVNDAGFEIDWVEWR